MPTKKNKLSVKTKERKVVTVQEEEPVSPVVRQVVEVVEIVGDEGEKPQSTRVQESDILDNAKEQDSQNADATGPAADEEPQTVSERKELVEELFKDESGSTVAPDISMHKNNGTLPLWLWVVIVISVALLVGFGLTAVVRGGISIPAFTAKSTPTPTASPTATPTPALARAGILVQVLNGSGIAGAAGKMKTLLEEAGYVVSDVGNADEYEYDETEIHVKPDKEAYIKLIQSDIQESYIIGSTSAALDDSGEYDVTIIVGKE